MSDAQNAPQSVVSAGKSGFRGISGSTIKIIAVLSMLIDHVAASVLERQLYDGGYIQNYMINEAGLGLYAVYLAMRMIGRLGFPIFAFLLVEGFQRTRDVKKYALRLGVFALISEVPFDLVFCGKAVYFEYQNVYFTLLLGLLALWGIDRIGKCKLPRAVWFLLYAAGILMPGVYLMGHAWSANIGGIKELLAVGVFGALAAAVALLGYGTKMGGDKMRQACANVAVAATCMCAAGALKTDYAGMGVLTIIVMYAFRKRKVISMLAGCIVLTIMSFSEITAFFALIPIALYNGSRGLKMKYFFYAFYPAHLALLYLLCVLLGLGGILLR